MNLRLDMPLEYHTVGRREVYVKREDLQGSLAPLPPWGKLYGIQRVLAEIDPTIPLIHLSIGQSYSGWALAAFGQELGMKIGLVVYDSKIAAPLTERAQSFGADIYPVRANTTNVMLGIMKRIATDEGYQYAPYGFSTFPFIDAMRERMETTPPVFESVVMAAGSGACLSGVLLGTDKPVYAITLSAPKTIERTIHRWLPTMPSNLTLIQSPLKLSTPVDDVAPFPCNRYWDAKAWQWLTKHIYDIPQPVLFYNLGA